MTLAVLPRRLPGELSSPRRRAIPDDVRAETERIVRDVRRRGEPALREHAERLDGLDPSAPLLIGADALRADLDALPADDQRRLERIAGRIAAFARAQLGALRPVTVDVPGGVAGHTVDPVERAGCYAPGGRYPLPSSVLMTAVTARVAGVGEVLVASPRPAPITRAAAAVAGADGLLAAGGAQAVAALAYGASPIPACDVVVGPGNFYVTSAKKLVAGEVRIDMLAGPSELVIVADDGADPALVAADLLAQAEHDDDALPILLATSEDVAGEVEAQLALQLADLPARETARAALAGGGACVCETIEDAARIASAIAPEHLQLFVREPDALLARIDHYGAAFLGEASAEVLGDYGAGPNHVLPTGGTARSLAGLSVMSFLRARTWLRMDPGPAPAELIDDVAWLARQEGLEAHARAAERRLPGRRQPRRSG